MGQTPLHATYMSAEHAAALLESGALVLPSTDPAYRWPADAPTPSPSSNSSWMKWPLSETIVGTNEPIAKLMVSDLFYTPFFSLSLRACVLTLMTCVCGGQCSCRYPHLIMCWLFLEKKNYFPSL